MPIYTFADLRATAPAHLKDASDRELLQRYSERVGMDPIEVANRLGYDGGASTLTKERISGSIDNYQSGLYETGAAVANGLGLNRARDFMERKAADNKFQADVAGARAKQLGGVDSYEDVDGVSSGLNYVGGLAAQSLPYAAEAMIGGWMGRVGSGALRAASLAGRAAGATEDVVQAGRAAEKALNYRGMAGATAASYPSSMGDILGNQREQIEANGGEMNYGSAALGAVPYSLLNGALGIESALSRGKLARSGVQALDNLTGVKGAVARTGASVGRTMLEEGTSELGQEFVNQGFGRMAVDPNETFFNPGSEKRFKESFAGGAALGGAFGAIGGHRRSEGYKSPDNPSGTVKDQTPELPTETRSLGYSPLAGTPTIFPDGTVALNGEQELAARFPNQVEPARGLNTARIGVASNPDIGVDRAGTAATNYDDKEALNDPGAELGRQRYLEQREEQARLTRIKNDANARAEEIKLQEKAAAEFGIKGTKGVGLFVELNALHRDGKITDGELTENLGLLGAKKNGAVKNWIEGQAATKQALADSKKAETAATLAAVQKPNTGGIARPVEPTAHKPNYSRMSYRELEAALDKAAASNDAMDVEAVRKHRGDKEAADFAKLSRRQKDRWMDANADEALERDSSTFQGIDEDKIRDFLGAVNNFDTTSAEALGRSIAIKLKDVDKPGFADSPEFATINNALAFAKAQGWSESTVMGAMRGRVSQWAGSNAEELFGRLFKETKKPNVSKPVPSVPATAESGGQLGAVKSGSAPAPGPDGSNGAGGSVQRAAGVGAPGTTGVAVRADGAKSAAVATVTAAPQDTNAAATRLIADLGLDENREVMIGRKGRETPTNARAFIHKLFSAPEEDVRRVMAVTGRDMEGHAVANPLSLDQVALLESRLNGGKPVSRQAIQHTLAKYGLTKEVVDMMVGHGVASVSESDLRGETGEDGIGNDNYRTAATLAGAAGATKINAGQSQSEGKLLEGTAAKRRAAEAAADAILKEDATKLAADNAAVDEYLAGPKQEAPEVQATRLSAARDNEVTPAGRLSMSDGELTEDDTDEGVQDRLRQLHAEDAVRAAQKAWNSTLRDGDVAFEDLPAEVRAQMLPILQNDIERTGELRSLLHHSVTNADITDAEESWVEFAIKSDASWDNLTAREQADWVGATIARYSVPSSVQAEKHYERRFREIAAEADKRLSKNAGGAARLGGKVPDGRRAGAVGENVATGRISYQAGKAEVGGDAAGSEARGDRVDSQTSNGGGRGTEAKPAPTITVKKRRVVEKPKLSVGDEAASSTVEQVTSELNKLGLHLNPRKVVVVPTLDALPAGVRASVEDENSSGGRVRGFVLNGKAYLIAGNIRPGTARSVFLHELGVHLAVEGILDQKTRDQLVAKIHEWADRNDDSIEFQIAQRALDRVGDAKVADEQAGSELMAYFVEEAVDAGIDPTAMSYKGDLNRWFRALYAAFKSAIRKLGLGSADKLTAQDVVDLAYGAAKLELEGTYHGTAATFRKFNHDYMNSGEGAQAYGWGTYLAQRAGIAKGYWSADVNRKFAENDDPILYDGKPFRLGQSMLQSHGQTIDELGFAAGLKAMIKDYEQRARNYRNQKWKPRFEADVAELKSLDPDKLSYARPEGSFMRTDTNVRDDEWLYWDKPLNEQSDRVKGALNATEDYRVDDFARGQRGEQLYYYMTRKLGSDQAASEFLDSIGIKGIKFLDAVSRDEPKFEVVYRDGEPIPSKDLDEMFSLGFTFDSDRDVDEANAFVERLMGDDETDAVVEQFTGGRPLQPRPEWLRRAYARGLDTRPNVNRTHNLVVFNDKNVFRALSHPGADRSRVKFSVEGVVRDVAAKVGGRSGTMLVDDALHQVSKGVRSMAFLHDLVEEYQGKLPSVRAWYKSMTDTVATRMELEAKAEQVAADAGQLKNGTKKVNEFVAKATVEQKWWKDVTRKVNGKEVTTQADPEMKRLFAALTPEEKKVVESLFAHADTMRETLYKVLKDLNITDDFLGTGKLQGPYAPLKRFGDYIAILKSRELAEATAADDKVRMAELKKDPKHYTVSFFDTLGQAHQFVEDNKAAYPASSYGEKDVRVGEEMPTNHAVLQRVVAALSNNKSMDPASKAAAEKMVRDMYFQSIDEHHARVHGLKRNNTAGYETDMVRSFLSHARAEASFIANLKHGAETNTQFYNMQRETRTKDGVRVNADIFNTFARHYAESLVYKDTPIQDRMVAATTVMQLALSPGYHLANAMQGIMVTLPRLAADFNNYHGAWKHLMKGYEMLKTTGISGPLNLDGVKDGNIKAMLQTASNLNLIDTGIMEDLSHFEATRTGFGVVDKASAAAKRAVHKLRQVSRAVETANRVSSAVAAYNMKMEHADPKSKNPVQDATDYAINILRTTQGDSTRMGAPLLLKRLPKVVTQYKKFQFMMMAVYVKAARQIMQKESAEVKAIGWRMMRYKLFHAGMAGGLMGLPLINAAQILYGAIFGGDDEPPDMERDLRKNIGDETLADMLLHGPLHFMGLDAKLGEEKVFSILPYADWNLTSAKGVMQMVAGLLGPSTSQTLRMADGLGQIKDGEYYKGMEKLMPSGVSNAMKAFRVANQGYTLRNGDVMFKPEDINGLALAFDALGLPSSEMKRMDWLRGQQYQVTQFFRDRTKAIEKDYAEAVKGGDSEAAADAREAWTDLQAGKDRLRYLFGDSHEELKRQPLSTLMKYPQTKAKYEARLQKAAVATQ